MPNDWNNDRQKAFREALLDAYRSYDALQVFVRDALDKNLAEIADRGEGLESVVFKVVDWADAKKRLPDLYGYFCEENSAHGFATGWDGGEHPEDSAGAAPTNLSRYRRAIPQFVGRDRDMAQLGDCIAAAGTVAIAAAVSGMGGLGKTELAWQWANREHRAGRFPGGVVWLDVAAGNPGEQLILFCQSEFGKDDEKLVPELPTIAGRVAYCWQHWAEWRSGEVLVVFDDVSRDRDAAKIVELQPSGEQFRTLWTTRDEWAGIRRYRLDKLDDAAARSLLASYIDEARLEAEPEAVEALLRWFGGLPLGLELAARYLALDDWLTIAEYLGELTLAHESLQENPEMRYPDGVEAAIAISWARLNPETEDGRAARRLAMRLGLFGAAPVPVVAEWRSAWRKPLQRLVSLNLVERDRDAVALHPLVRQFVRGQLVRFAGADKLRREVAAAIVGQGKQIEYTFTMAQAREYAPWIPHLEILAEELMTWLEDEDAISPCERIAYFYFGQGMYDLTEPWMLKCVAVAWERLGVRPADRATALNNLAGLYEMQGNYEAAKPLCQEALAILRESLPANHPQLATHLNNLASLYRAQGEYGLSEPLYQEALAIKRESLPANHPSLATGLNNLANLYREQRKYGLAEPLYQQALAIDRESLPANHPSLATGLNNLAGLYERQGKYEAGEPLYLDALTIFMKSLGDGHANTQHVLHNVVRFYQTALAAGHPDIRLRTHPLGDLIRSRLNQDPQP